MASVPHIDQGQIEEGQTLPCSLEQRPFLADSEHHTEAIQLLYLNLHNCLGHQADQNQGTHELTFVLLLDPL
jgi:hypothetical protein